MKITPRTYLLAPLTGLCVVIFWLIGAPVAQANDPVINVWYGHRQIFGQPGKPQTWINVLGNVSNPEDVQSLTYSLNGGLEQRLRIGSDERRLFAPGDFNIEIAYADLKPGLNEIVLTANNKTNSNTTETITIEYVDHQSGPTPYSIDWNAVESVQNVVQVVDGKWFLDDNGLRTDPDYVGYDRIVAIGDMSWTDYEITVPITVHDLDERSYDMPGSVGPGLGLLFRWKGHTDFPIACPQPHCGYEPIGGGAWYEWHKDQPGKLNFGADYVNLLGNGISTPKRQIEIGHTYWFKQRVETTPLGSLYSLKVWEEGVETEPSTWDKQTLTTAANFPGGSLLFVAHHIDATFGNVTITSAAAQSRGELFVNLSGYAVQLPLILISLIGIGLALTYRHRSPKGARAGLMAMILLFIATGVDIFLDMQLPSFIYQQGFSVRGVLIAVAIKDFTFYLIVAVCLGLLIVTLLRWQNEQNSK